VLTVLGERDTANDETLVVPSTYLSVVAIRQ
jgi:hypothetical protein